jgi:hypothetical protein
VKISDIEPDILQTILHHVYAIGFEDRTFKIEDTAEMAIFYARLWKWADFFGMQELADEAQRTFCMKISAITRLKDPFESLLQTIEFVYKHVRECIHHHDPAEWDWGPRGSLVAFVLTIQDSFFEVTKKTKKLGEVGDQVKARRQKFELELKKRCPDFYHDFANCFLRTLGRSMWECPGCKLCPNCFFHWEASRAASCPRCLIDEQILSITE